MSNVVPIVVGTGLQSDAADAVDDANDHTPAPVQPPGVEHVPDRVTPEPHEGKDELREIVSRLADTVAALTATVAGLTAPDKSPQSLPWTHRSTR